MRSPRVLGRVPVWIDTFAVIRGQSRFSQVYITTTCTGSLLQRKLTNVRSADGTYGCGGLLQSWCVGR